MKIRATITTAILLVTFALPARADVTLKSKDGAFELSAPNGWRESKPAGPAIKIQATNGRGALVLVRVVSKEDFKDFESFTNAGIARSKRNMPDAEPKLENIQVNGKPAVRASFFGTQSNGARKGVLLTFFEAEGHFIDVITTASASVFNAEQPALQAMASRLKVNAAPAAAPAAPAAAAAPEPAPAPAPAPTRGRQPR